MKWQGIPLGKNEQGILKQRIYQIIKSNIIRERDKRRCHTLLATPVSGINDSFNQLLINTVITLMESLPECLSYGENMWGRGVLSGVLKMEIIILLIGDSKVRFQ